MSSIVYLKNKSNGKVYAYSNYKTWDSSKGKYVYRRKCIGHLDPETGYIVENRERKTRDGSSVRSIGANTVLSRLSEETGLSESLQIVFPDVWKQILSCAFFLLSERKSLSSITRWKKSHELPYAGDIDSNELNFLLNRISDEDVEAFLRIWRKKVSDEDVVYATTSSISSYDYLHSYYDPVIASSTVDIGICAGAGSNLPISYEMRMNTVTSESEMDRIRDDHRWLGAKNILFMLRRGVFESSNFTDALTGVHNCTLRLPNDHPLSSGVIRDIQNELLDYHNYDTTHWDPQFSKSVKKLLNGKRVNIHVFYNADIAEKDTGMLLTFLDKCMNELISETPVRGHERFYERYFITKTLDDGSLEVEFNSEAIMEDTNKTGFLILASNHLSDSGLAFSYNTHAKDAEMFMRNLWNDEDHTGLKLYLQHNMNSMIFIRFVSMILYFSISRTLKEYNLTNEYSVESVMSELNSIMSVETPLRKSPLITDLTTEQKRILTLFGMTNVFGSDEL